MARTAAGSAARALGAGALTAALVASAGAGGAMGEAIPPPPGIGAAVLSVPPGSTCAIANPIAPAGTVDCKGRCITSLYIAWVGDGICDNGRYGSLDVSTGALLETEGKEGIDWNCDAFAMDGGDCDAAGEASSSDEAQESLRPPTAYFPLNEGFGVALGGTGSGGKRFSGEMVGMGATWESDEIFGQTLRCSETLPNGTEVADGGGAHALLNITGADYGASGEFTIGLFFKDLSGIDEFVFEYLLSHGSGLSTENVTGVWGPNNIALYLPEKAHSAGGVVRAVVSDQGAIGETIYFDTDGLRTSNDQRVSPGHINIFDGEWHSLVIVATPQLPDVPSARLANVAGLPGLRFFVDGRFSGLLAGSTGYTGRPFLPEGQMHLCTPLNLNGDRRFSGQLAHVAVWDTGLTENEVLQFHEGVLAGDDSPGGDGSPFELVTASTVCAEREAQITSPVSNRPCCGMTPPVRGDADGNGQMTVTDIVSLVRVVLKEASLTACQEIALDLNEDGTIDLADAQIMQDELAAP